MLQSKKKLFFIYGFPCCCAFSLNGHYYKGLNVYPHRFSSAKCLPRLPGWESNQGLSCATSLLSCAKMPQKETHQLMNNDLSVSIYPLLGEYMPVWENVEANISAEANIFSDANIRFNVYLFCIKSNICMRICANILERKWSEWCE
jgi:hypothetical protein